MPLLGGVSLEKSLEFSKSCIIPSYSCACGPRCKVSANSLVPSAMLQDMMVIDPNTLKL